MLSITLSLLLGSLASAYGPPSVPPQWVSEARPAGEVRRVVTLAPSAAETLIALGLSDRIVGTTRYFEAPKGMQPTRVGGILDPNLETILSLKPDLVLATPVGKNRAVLERLAKFGVPVFVVPGSSLSDIFHAIEAIGEVMKAAPAAQTRGAALKADLDALAKQAKSRPKTKLAVVYSYRPLIAAGPGSFMDELMGLLNAENVVKQGTRYPQIALESLLVATPDWVLSHVKETPPKALQSLRVKAIDIPELLRPSPGITTGLAKLLRLLDSAKGVKGASGAKGVSEVKGARSPIPAAARPQRVHP